jgi:MFS family permease
MKSPARLVARVCLAEVLSMTAVAVYPALLPVLAKQWLLSNAEAGTIGGVFYGGYMAAVPLLTGLTDRIDPRRIYLSSCALAAAGALGFSFLAQGWISAAFFQAVLGASLAGTYMPGLRLLSDHLEGPGRSRAVSFYTSSFGVGTSLSLWLAGQTEAAVDWRAAFLLAAAGPLLAVPLILSLPSGRRSPPGGTAPAFQFRSVFQNTAALSYIVGYAAHCWELFGFRSWLVAFLTFAAARQPHPSWPFWSAASVAAAIGLAGPPASILGNEIAARSDRKRFVRAVRMASLALAALVGFTAQLPWPAVVAAVGLYFLFIMSDSAALTAGLLDVASPSERGATMAVHSFMGFAAAFIAPIVFGVVLDRAGGADSLLAWGLSFLSLGTGYALAWAAGTKRRAAIG